MNFRQYGILRADRPLFGSRRHLPSNKPFSVEISGRRKIEIDYKRNPFVTPLYTPLYTQDSSIIVLAF